MKTVAVIQARTGSTRLPGKVLMDLAGAPMLARQLARVKRCRELDAIVVATSDLPADDPVEKLAREQGVESFRGSERDVLSRYVGAATEAGADVVVRITADCPLIDPQVTDRVVRELIDHRSCCDYASNIIERTYPDGLDVEALFMDVLLRIDRLAQRADEREHVTLAVANHPDLFLCRHVKDTEDNSALRWTVDHPEDLERVRAIFTGMGLDRGPRPYRETLAWVREH